MRLKLATRGSKLALIQTGQVQGALSTLGMESEAVVHSTQGDRDRKGPIYSMSSVGVFVEELNSMVSSGECDAAVHSAKDIPSRIPDDLEVSAVLPRASVNDALVSESSLADLPERSRIGTSSMRRVSSLRSARPDLRAVDIRGNIDTRLSKLANGECEGIIVALAALERMQLDVKYFVLDTSKFTPAPNQGTIAVITKKGSDISQFMGGINHQQTSMSFQIERELVTGLSLGCSMPVGILCTPGESLYHVSSTFYSLNSNDYRSYESDVRGKEEAGKLVAEIKRTLPVSFGYRFGAGRQ